MCLTLGMPGSGHEDVARLLTRAMDHKQVIAYNVDRATAEDVILLAPAVGTFIVVNRDVCAAKYVAALESLGEGWLHIPTVEERTTALFDRLSEQEGSWKFDPVVYVAAFRELYTLEVPTHPIGGIFFHRAHDKTLVVSLQWERLADVLPILEFVIGERLDRATVLNFLSQGKWHDLPVAQLTDNNEKNGNHQ